MVWYRVGYEEIVEDRIADTLVPIINHYILPDTTITSDCWPSTPPTHAPPPTHTHTHLVQCQLLTMQPTVWMILVSQRTHGKLVYSFVVPWRR